MPDWLSAWRSRRRSEAPLAVRLRSYPPHDLPHPGHGARLTEAQARANLAYFEQVLPVRLELLAGLLRDQADIDARAALAAPREQAAPLADALHRWAAAAWPPLQAGRPAALAGWLDSPRRGVDIVYALLLDVAMLLGELIRRANPDWRWGLDLDPQNLVDDMPSARRVVLLADPVGPMRRPFLLDVEDAVVHRFLHPDDPGQQLLNPWRRLVEQAIRGDAMAYWRQAGGARPRPAGADPS